VSTKELSESPAKVTLAVKMLYLVVGIGVVRAAMTVIRHWDVRSPNFLIFVKLLIYAASLYLIYEVGNGKNWARWSMVGILVVSTPLTILPNFDSITHNLIHAIFGFLQLGLYIVAVLFLFHESCTGWFGAGKISKQQ
jgi:hypothetical protein